MTPAQSELVARRSRVIRQWPLLGLLVLLVVLGLYGFAIKRLPIVVEPGVLAANVKAGLYSLEGMGRMVVIGSFAFMACGVCILAVLAVVTLSLENEKRLIGIVQAQEAELASMRQPAVSSPAPDTAAPAPGDGV